MHLEVPGDARRASNDLRTEASLHRSLAGPEALFLSGLHVKSMLNTIQQRIDVFINNRLQPGDTLLVLQEQIVLDTKSRKEFDRMFNRAINSKRHEEERKIARTIDSIYSEQFDGALLISPVLRKLKAQYAINVRYASFDINEDQKDSKAAQKKNTGRRYQSLLETGIYVPTNDKLPKSVVKLIEQCYACCSERTRLYRDHEVVTRNPIQIEQIRTLLGQHRDAKLAVILHGAAHHAVFDAFGDDPRHQQMICQIPDEMTDALELLGFPRSHFDLLNNWQVHHAFPSDERQARFSFISRALDLPYVALAEFPQVVREMPPAFARVFESSAMRRILTRGLLTGKSTRELDMLVGNWLKSSAPVMGVPLDDVLNQAALTWLRNNTSEERVTNICDLPVVWFKAAVNNIARHG